MRLRIIDIPCSEGGENRLELIFENHEEKYSFTTETYSSPVSPDFYNKMFWYFNEYPLQISEQNDQSIAEKIIKLGHYLGDELLGEDHQLIKIKETIEDTGFQFLDVQIESKRPEFYKELWELVVLYESKYILSAVVKSFARRLVCEELDRNLPELRYDLNYIPPTLDIINQELIASEQVVNTPSKETTRPLNILCLVSRTERVELQNSQSNSFNLCVNAANSGGAMVVEIFNGIDWQQLQNRLSDKQRPVHIFHYDGPLLAEQSDFSVPLQSTNESDSSIELSKLCKLLALQKVALLSIDSRGYFNEKQRISSQMGLAQVALIAHQQGLGNVIGLTEVALPWVSGSCFEAIYNQLVKGICLSQAVVEARKELQSRVETSLFTSSPIAFQPWSLLVHYAQQSVYFFESQQANSEQNALQAFSDKLYGFDIGMLPPLAVHFGDRPFLELITNLTNYSEFRTSNCVLLDGEEGSGKTHLAHLVGFYFVQTTKVDYGFYFDYNQGFYSEKDILEMIAPIFKLKVEQANEVVKKLSELNCYFVFDNFPNESELDSKFLKEFIRLKNYIPSLIAQGHKLVLIKTTTDTPFWLDGYVINVEPLGNAEQKLLAANLFVNQQGESARKEKISDTDWRKLLVDLRGNPWLIKKVMPMLYTHKVEDLQAQLAQNLTKGKVSVVEQYYQWQWSNLDPIWQQLLLLCTEVKGLLFEMLMVADQQKVRFEPAKSLFELLGEPEADIAIGLDKLEATGFLIRKPHGRCIDTRSLEFLRAIKLTQEQNDNSDLIELSLSQLITEGVRLLSLHVINQPNPGISNNLLLNRRTWVVHLENLWFNGDYKGFFAAKTAFDQLLLQAKLVKESNAWILDLISRTPLATDDNAKNIQAQIAWLGLAANILGVEQSIDNQSILDAEKVWREWFDRLSDTEIDNSLTLYHQVVRFLELYYARQSNWQESILIAQSAYQIYEQHKAWKKVLKSLSALASYYTRLEQEERVLHYEEKILKDVPYEDAPPGFKTQQMLDIILARISRKNFDKAQSLLDETRGLADAVKIKEVLDGCQCDIQYQTGDYLAALPHYCKLWIAALSANQPVQIKQLQSRMFELEEKLGSDVFNQKFTENVSEGIILPRDYTD